MGTIEKCMTETYKVRTQHEWATIAVREWTRKDERNTYHCGEIMINSPFGQWGNSWGHCGMRFKKFLITCDFDYIFGKFMGHALRVYDGDATLREVKRKIILGRARYGDFDKEDARAVFDAVVDRSGCIGDSLHDFVNAMSDVARQVYRPPDWMLEPWEIAQDRYNPQAVGFWEDIWPVFKAEIERELAQESAPA